MIVFYEAFNIHHAREAHPKPGERPIVGLGYSPEEARADFWKLWEAR